MNKGIIRITHQLYHNNYDVISAIFRDFKPLHIECEYWNIGDFKFYGESDSFDEIKEGDVIPEYLIEITTHDDGIYSYKFIKL